MEITVSSVVTWVSVIVTAIVLRIALGVVISRAKPENDDDKALVRSAMRGLNFGFWCAVVVTTAWFMLLMLWTGWRPAASQTPVEGVLKTKGALSLPDEKGETQYEDRTAKEIVSEGKESLDDFRKDMLQEE